MVAACLYALDLAVFFLFFRTIVTEQRILGYFIFWQKITPYEQLDQKRMNYNIEERKFQCRDRVQVCSIAALLVAAFLYVKILDRYDFHALMVIAFLIGAVMAAYLCHYGLFTTVLYARTMNLYQNYEFAKHKRMLYVQGAVVVPALFYLTVIML